MGYDDVIQQMGEFGRYQRRIFLILSIPAITCGLHKMSGVFLAAEPDFRCLLPHESQENATYQIPSIVTNLSYPWNDSESWPRCERLNFELADQSYDLNGNLSSTPSTVRCDSFVFDKSQYTHTATSEWNLVCDKVWLRTTSNAIYMVGEMLGSMIFGGLSDRYGRKVTFVWALIIQLLSGILVAVSPEFISYAIFRLIVGFTSSGVFLITYVLALEICGPKKRLVAGTACQLLIVSGLVGITGLAYCITNWRMLQIALTVPSFIFVAYWWFVPESARWLLSKGRVQDAKDMLQKAASENGVELSQDILEGLSDDNGKTTSTSEPTSLFDLLKYPNLRRRSLLLFFLWFVNSGTFYGLSWNTSLLEGNDYINYGITAAVEIPGNLMALFTLDKWGRKIILCGCMLLAGTSLLLTLIVPANLPWLVVVLAIFGKLAITCSYSTVYVFTAELYPTEMRNVGLGACSTSARLAGILAPYFHHLAQVWTELPLVVLGSCSMIAGSLSLLLPETMNTKLPESIQDSEQFGKKIDKCTQDMSEMHDSKAARSTTTLDNELQI